MSFRPLISIVLAAGLTGLVSTSAAAQMGESGYAVLGKWIVSTVWANPNTFGYCAATTNNGKADFRIGTDGRGWQIGTPYYGNKRKLEAYYGFGMAAEVAQRRVEGDVRSIGKLRRVRHRLGAGHDSSRPGPGSHSDGP